MTESWMPKIVIDAWQHDYLRNSLKGDKDLVDAFIRHNFDVIEPLETMHDIRSRINNELRDRLGSLPSEQQSGMAQNSEAPKLRGLSYGPHSVYFDETCHITEVDSGSAHWSRIPESDPVQLAQWVQRRGICRRMLSCGLS